MTHPRCRRLVLLILAGALLAVPSWGTQGKYRSAAGTHGTWAWALEAFGDPLNPQAGCEMDPNGVHPGHPLC
jgi:hypothetical protein